jgi:lipopolysaccharide export LptBFGC system permease protein LptF
MDEIFSYWPILIFIFAILSRIMRTVNKRQNNVIKKSEVDTKPLNDKQDEAFSFDKEDNMSYQKEESKTSVQKGNVTSKMKIKKIRIKKVKKQKNNNIIRNKDDLVRGIIIKEVLDKPKFRE